MDKHCYTTWGPVRGDCGHEHRTLQAAERCLAADRQGCSRQGGYSDREVRRIRKGALDSYHCQYGPR